MYIGFKITIVYSTLWIVVWVWQFVLKVPNLLSSKKKMKYCQKNFVLKLLKVSNVFLTKDGIAHTYM